MNTFGQMFRVTTWGESHNKAMGCVIDGCPAGLCLTTQDIKYELDRDVPDTLLGTPRKEPNQVEIMSGLYQGKTIGTPISIIIYNKAHKSSDYESVKHFYRPGHAEFTYHKRYGIYNPYGGGRASGRECVARLTAGAVAKKLLSPLGITFHSGIEELAGISCTSEESARKARKKCLEIGKNKDASGGIISLKVSGVPAGIGAPVFDKLHARIMYAVSTIGGVKGVECGLGFEVARKTACQVNDPFEMTDDGIVTSSNNCGGVLGGISTGGDLYFRLAVKPTPSIPTPQKTVNWKTGKEQILAMTGRFDKNFAPRVGPIAESMAAIVLVDHLIRSGWIHPVKVPRSTADA